MLSDLMKSQSALLKFILEQQQSRESLLFLHFVFWTRHYFSPQYKHHERFHSARRLK